MAKVIALISERKFSPLNLDATCEKLIFKKIHCYSIGPPYVFLPNV